MKPNTSHSLLSVPSWQSFGWTKRAALQVIVSENLAQRRKQAGQGNRAKRRAVLLGVTLS